MQARAFTSNKTPLQRNVPGLHTFFGLEPLRSWLDYLIIAVALLGWAICVRFAWRRRLLDRYLDIDLEGPTIIRDSNP